MRLFVSYRNDGVEVKLQKETVTRCEAEGERRPLLVAKLFGAEVGIDAVFDLQHARRLELCRVSDIGARGFNEFLFATVRLLCKSRGCC